MTKDTEKTTPKKLYYFSTTMTDLLRACFSDTDSYHFEGTESIDFFLYMVKYQKNHFTTNSLDRNTLLKTLILEGGNSDTPEIPILFNFLLLHLLKKDDTSIRENTYRDKSNHLFIQKSFPELADYCRSKLKLEPKMLTDITTQDSIIDIITICFLIGRHGFAMQSQSQLLHSLFPTDIKSNLLSSLDKTTHFTVIHGTVIERTNNYVLKYIKTQLYNISHCISYKSYQNNELPKGISLDILHKNKETKSQLYPAILNAYLLQNKEHYFIIHSIPSQDALNSLIKDCKLYKNIILICDYDIASPKNNENILYLPFHSFYKKPQPETISLSFKKNNIDIANPNEMSNTLLSASKGNLFLLHTLILLIQNLWNSKKDKQETIEKLKESLDALSLNTDKNPLPTDKFSMSNTDNSNRSGNNLIGHIRKIYKDILSVDEWLLVLLTALHGDKGLPENLIADLDSKNTSNRLLDTMASLVNMNLIKKEDNKYVYIDSLLIPYALLYGKFNIENSFSEVLIFLNFMLDEICYHNSAPIDYGILCTTIKKTHKATFSLLYKSSSDYNEHFAEIWYYHIRCIKFFLENGDIDTIEELNKNFNDLAKKLTSRPGEKYKHWKKLYIIYMDFLNLYTKTASNPSNSWESHISFIDSLIKRIEYIKQHDKKNFTKPSYSKLLLSLLEMNISHPFQLCVSGLWEKRTLQEENDMKLYIKKLEEINQSTQQIFKINFLPEDKNFISEIRVAFITLIELTDIYMEHPNFTVPHISTFIYSKNFDTAPRYTQLASFHINCVLLSEQCYSGYVSLKSAAAFNASNLQKKLDLTYSKLETVPLNILQDYYYALIYYVLALVPSDTDKLLNYIYTDFKRYEHIWKHSEILSRIEHSISEFRSNKLT